MYPYGETVTVVPYLPGVEDAHGNVSDTWGAGVDWPGCAVDSQSSEPVEPGRDAVVDVGKVYGPYDMQVNPHDRVLIRGSTWEVVGEVWREQNPFTGQRPGCWFGIRKVVG